MSRRVEYDSRGRTSRDLETTEISGELHHETEKAYLFYDGKTEDWVPKSQASWDSTDQIMSMPLWLAQKKGFV